MHTRLVFSEQKSSDRTFSVVNLVDHDTSATIAQIQVLGSHPGAIHVDISFQVTTAILESRVQIDVHSKRGTRN